MSAFGEFLDHLLVKRWNVIRLATGHESIIHHDFLVDPICSGVAHIRSDRQPGGHGSAADQARADQDLRSMTNSRYWFAFVEEVTRKLERILIRPQRIRKRFSFLRRLH